MSYYSTQNITSSLNIRYFFSLCSGKIERWFLIAKTVSLFAGRILENLAVLDRSLLIDWCSRGLEWWFYTTDYTPDYNQKGFLATVLMEILGDEYDANNSSFLRERIIGYQRAIADSIEDQCPKFYRYVVNEREPRHLNLSNCNLPFWPDWLVIYGDNEKEKKRVILERLQILRSSPTPLKLVEMGVFSNLIKRPIYLFDRTSITLTDEQTGEWINKKANDEMPPYELLGEFWFTKPILLYAGEDFFCLLKRKEPLERIRYEQNDISTLT